MPIKQMVKKNDNKYIELSFRTSLYTEPDKDGKTKLIKKDIPIKVSVYINDISGHEEVFNNKGKILKGFCRIHHEKIGSIIVKESYSKIRQLKERDDKPPHLPIGFKYKNKI